MKRLLGCFFCTKKKNTGNKNADGVEKNQDNTEAHSTKNNKLSKPTNNNNNNNTNTLFYGNTSHHSLQNLAYYRRNRKVPNTLLFGNTIHHSLENLAYYRTNRNILNRMVLPPNSIILYRSLQNIQYSEDTDQCYHKKLKTAGNIHFRRRNILVQSTRIQPTGNKQMEKHENRLNFESYRIKKCNTNACKPLLTKSLSGYFKLYFHCHIPKERNQIVYTMFPKVVLNENLNNISQNGTPDAASTNNNIETNSQVGQNGLVTPQNNSELISVVQADGEQLQNISTEQNFHKNETHIHKLPETPVSDEGSSHNPEIYNEPSVKTKTQNGSEIFNSGNVSVIEKRSDSISANNISNHLDSKPALKIISNTENKPVKKKVSWNEEVKVCLIHRSDNNHAFPPVMQVQRLVDDQESECNSPELAQRRKRWLTIRSNEEKRITKPGVRFCCGLFDTGDAPSNFHI